MKTTLICIALIYCTNITFGQDIINDAASKPSFNTTGDPITNIIDADGSKQGEWYFQDCFGDQVIKKVYESNICIRTEYLINGNWRDSQSFETDPIEIFNSKNELGKALLKRNIELTNSDDRQLLLLVNKKNELIEFYPLGNWEKTILKDLKTQIEATLKNTHLNLQNETIILF